ncbi:MAG: hypothetical protein J5522_03830 [Lachnospiraceae bacterium]|nr:hypothetical protein [Lachnospiraceae bacterium]
MRSFFIDLENVRSYGLEGILLLKPEDKVYVFYSDNANTLTIPTIESLNESSAQVKYIKTNYTGANAMDFQIVTLLGASIEKERAGQFYIISHDNGFKSAVKFCEGYFTGYDIVTGVFANILLAINSENGTQKGNSKQASELNNANRQNTVKIQPANDENKNSNVKVPVPDDQTEQPTAKKSRNRRRKRNANATAQNAVNQTAAENAEAVKQDAKPKEAEPANIHAATGNDIKQAGRARGKNRTRSEKKVQERNAATENVAVSASHDNAVISQPEAGTLAGNETKPVKAQDNEQGRQKNKNRRRKGRSQNNGNNAGTNTDADVNVNASVNVNVNTNANTNANTSANKNVNTNNALKTGQGSYKYVYNALSDFLSKTTIDMYAAKIDEGIRKSKNKNELHEFFKKSYGSDEAEALYKIICSDFEKMKKSAGN